MNTARRTSGLVIAMALGAPIVACNATFNTSGTLETYGGSGHPDGSTAADGSAWTGDPDASWPVQVNADSSSPEGDAATDKDATGGDATAAADAAPLTPTDRCSAACASMKTSACPDFDESVCDGDCNQTGVPTTALTTFAGCVQDSGGLCTNSLSCWQTFQTQIAN